MLNEYEDIKHDFNLDFDRTDQYSAAMRNFNDLGPSFDEDPVFATMVSVAIASIEVSRFDKINDCTKHMFKETYKLVDDMEIGVHCNEEEKKSMKRDVDIVIKSKKIKL